MSDLKPIKPLSGFIELSPYQQKIFDMASERVKKVFSTAGFMHLDLPTIERAEVLGGSSEEVSTQIYFFEKGDTKMGLRYDGTVGFARYIAGHQQDLFFPFRSYQFAKNYRGERPQKGRYREFWQMDIDIIDENFLSENYDAEIINVIMRGYKSLEDLIGSVKVHIGSRSFWNAVFKYLELDTAKSDALFSLIDKKAKLTPDDFRLSLIDILGENKTEFILDIFNHKYNDLSYQNNELLNEIDKLSKFEKILQSFGLNSDVDYVIDLSIMRGHGYYTGIVFEFFSTLYPELGAIGGGGRYENLCQDFTKKQYLGVGGSIGFSRMLVNLLEENKINSPVDTCKISILIMDNNCLDYAIKITEQLRNNNIQTISYLDTSKKFKKQMEFANKINSGYVAIIGDEEVKQCKITLKNMKNGDQSKVSLDELISILK